MSGEQYGVQCPPEENLSRLADGERFPDDRQRRLETHLDRCDLCRRKYERFRDLGKLLRDAFAQTETVGSAELRSTHISLEMLGTYLDGGPAPDERVRLERHLASCHKCLDELVTLYRTLRQGRADELEGQDQQRTAAVDMVRELQVHAGRPAAAITCPSCGTAAPGDAQYCTACGTLLAGGQAARYCLHCSARVPPTSAYCPNCGRMLGAAADESHPVWPAVVQWVRERRMQHLSLIVAVVAMFTASFYSFRKYQLYAVAALATVKWIADVVVNGLVRALVRADPTVRSQSSRLRRREIVTTVLTSLSGFIARHAWLLAAAVAFLLSVLPRLRAYFAEFVIVGTLLALKWIIDESGIRLALSLLQAWRSRDAEQVDRLLAELRRRDVPRKRKQA